MKVTIRLGSSAKAEAAGGETLETEQGGEPASSAKPASSKVRSDAIRATSTPSTTPKAGRGRSTIPASVGEPSRPSGASSFVAWYLARSLPAFIGIFLAASSAVVLLLSFLPLGAILLLVSLAATVVGVWSLTAALGLRRVSAIACGYSVIFCAQLVGLVLLVGGALRQLNPTALTLSSLVLAVAEVIAVRRWAPPQRGAGRLVLAALRVAVTRARHHPVVVVLGLLVLAQYLLQVAITLWVPQFSYDSLYYHLIAPDTWIQHGAIVHSQQRLAADAYPQDQEAISAFVGTFLHTLRYTGLTQLPFAALAATALAFLARTLGVRRSHATLAGLGFLAMPAVFLQAPTAYVDVAAAATVLAALAFLLAAPAAALASGRGTSGLVPHLVVAGMATGLAAGVKSTNVLLVPIVVLFALVQYGRVASQSREAGPGLPAWAAFAWLLVPIVALGSFWYVRTWITYGNPFYPVSILWFKGLGSVSQLIIGANKPATLNHLPLGPLGSVFSSWIFDLHPHNFVYDQRLGGLGPAWILLGAPALAICIVAFARRRLDYLLGLVLPVVALAVASEAPWWARYTMALAGVGWVCLAWCLEMLAQSHLRWRLGAPLMAGVFVALSGLAMWWATDPLDVPVVRHGTLTNATVGDVASMITQPMAQRYQQTDPWYAYQALSVLPDNSVVAETDFYSDPFTHPIVGDHLQRQLVVLGAPATTSSLADQMTKANARYLLLPSQGAGSGLTGAVSRDTSQFKLLASGETVNGQSLYELGSFDCGVAHFVLAGSPSQHGRPLSIGATLEDSCGPIANAPVTLWQGLQTSPGTQGAKVIAALTTDSSGRVRAVVAHPLAKGDYFLRYGGGRVGGKDHGGAASAIFTSAQVP